MYKLIFNGFLALCLTTFITYKLIKSDVNLIELKNASIAHMTQSITDDLDRAMPIINTAGYKVFSIQAQLSLPPKVFAIFEYDRYVDNKTQDMLVQALDDNMIGQLVLISLIDAFEIEKTISLKNMELKRINITIGIPPSIIVDYR
jgi:hypothetical protein